MKLSANLPVRQLISALAAAGLGYLGLDACSDILAYSDRTPVDQHENWIILLFLFMAAGGAALSALTPNKKSPGPMGIIRQFLGQLRHGLFTVTVLLLEVVLIATLFSLIIFSCQDGFPPMHWGRVGGVLTDWVIEICLILPLLLVGAVFNLFLLSSREKAGLIRR